MVTHLVPKSLRCRDLVGGLVAVFFQNKLGYGLSGSAYQKQFGGIFVHLKKKNYSRDELRCDWV